MTMANSSSGGNSRQRFSGPPETINNPRGFWRTTGCATVVAAVIGAGATLLAQQIASSSSTTPGSGTVTGADQGQSGVPSEPERSDVLWKNHFNMGNYVSFDTIPPQNEKGTLSQDVEGTYHVYDDGALWESPTPPSKQQCVEKIATHGQASIPMDMGTQFCYRTSGGRVVFIKVIGVQPGDGLLTSPRFETEVTIWSK